MDNNKACAVLFIDLSKAFDTVDHTVLLQKLHSIGLDKNALKWFENYLQNRQQCVSIGNFKSGFLQVENGVPQGSVLGPILFNIYMADIASSVTGCKVHMYADDTVLFCSADDIQAAVTNLQHCFSDLQNEFKKNKLVLNANKTKYMIFTSETSVDAELVISSMNGTHIERVRRYKYLGLWIDEELSFKHHVATLESDLVSRRITEHQLKTKFLPKLDYGDILYMHASPDDITLLDEVYHAALTFITNDRDDAEYHEVYHEMRLLCPSLMRESHLLLFIYKALKGFLPPYIRSMLVIDKKSPSDCIWLEEQEVFTDIGKTRLSYFGPKTWNEMQGRQKLNPSVSFRKAKSLILSYLTRKCSCPCQKLTNPKWRL